MTMDFPSIELGVLMIDGWCGGSHLDFFVIRRCHLNLKTSYKEWLCCIEQNVDSFENSYIQNVEVTEMRILWWINRYIMRDRNKLKW